MKDRKSNTSNQNVLNLKTSSARPTFGISNSHQSSNLNHTTTTEQFTTPYRPPALSIAQTTKNSSSALNNLEKLLNSASRITLNNTLLSPDHHSHNLNEPQILGNTAKKLNPFDGGEYTE